MPDNPNTADSQKPRRRWFQFRLRTLLIGIAVLGSACGGYIAYEGNVVQERGEIWRRFGGSGAQFIVREASEAAPEVSWLRRQLGDRGILVIRIQKDYAQEREIIAEAFPEARVEISR